MSVTVLPYGYQVYVGDPSDPVNLWTEVYDLATAGATRSYTAAYSGGQLTITFGDGINGLIPSGQITVVYLTATAVGSGSSSSSSSSSGSSSSSSGSGSGSVNYWQRLRYCASGGFSPYYFSIPGPGPVFGSFRQTSTGYCYTALSTDTPTTVQPLNVIATPDLITMPCGQCLGKIIP